MAGFFDKVAGSAAKEDVDTMSGSEIEEVQNPAILKSEARTLKPVREAVQELLKYGLLEENQKPNLYRTALTNTEEISHILQPLDLEMGIDEIRGLLYVAVRQDDLQEQDEWAHPLVRRQRLNLEQSLLVAMLRKHFIAYEQESGTGAGQATIAVDELIPQLQVYLGDPGSESKERTRVINLLDQLKGHGLVSALDAQERVTIRPIIAHLANPENLQALLVWLQEQVENKSPAEDDRPWAGMEDMT